MSSSLVLRRQTGRSILALKRFYTHQPETPPKTSGETRIYNILQTRFTPQQLKVEDISGGCGDFYSIDIASSAFQGLTTLKQHRIVQEELKDVIKDIHGLRLKTLAI